MTQIEQKIREFTEKNQGRKIVVFGCGKRGRALGRVLPSTIEYYVDNDPGKWDAELEGKSVHRPSQLLNEVKETLLIIVVSFYYKPIMWQLEEMGFVEDEHFINGLDVFGDVLKRETAGAATYNSRNVWLRGDAKVEGDCRFDGHNVVLDGSHLITTSMGRYSTIGRKGSIRKTTIGQFCSIGSDVHIGLQQHPSKDFISTYGAFYIGKPTGIPSFVERSLFNEGSPTHIGNDVWIGTRVLILSGITIGDGAILGAGAIVTKDVEPYSVVAGVPARLMRKRYSADKIDLLLRFAWWNKDIEWIREHALLFSHESRFFELIAEGART